MSIDLSSLGVIKMKGSSGDGVLSISAPKLTASQSINVGADPVGAAISTTELGTLTTVDSGKVFAVDIAAADITIALPVCQPGLKYKFFLNSNATTNVATITPNAGAGDKIYGNYFSGVGAVTAPKIDGKATLSFGKAATTGDCVELIGMAANKWYAVAISAVKDAITQT